MWTKTDVIPNLGAHAVKYARHAAQALGRRVGKPSLPRDEVSRHSVFLGLSGAFSVLATDMAFGGSMTRVLAGVTRVIHEAVALLGVLGFDEGQINAVLAEALDNEMARVDPTAGLLGENGDQPYVFGSLIIDPPGFKDLWEHGVMSKIHALRLSARSKDEPEL